MVRVEDVPRWLVRSGVGHAIFSESTAWAYTVCNMATTGGESQAERPARICSHCRKVLAAEKTKLKSPTHNQPQG